jgi:hypothetical protein
MWYATGFFLQNIDGKKLLELTRDQIVNLTGMKVSASLKISEMIQQLKTRVDKL